MSVEFQSITDTFAVSPQLAAADMVVVADAGFKSVIITRPDFELESSQVDSSVMLEAAEKAGLVARYLPVVASDITAENVQEFKQLFAELPKPILAYCRSGTRCFNLYKLAQQID